MKTYNLLLYLFFIFSFISCSTDIEPINDEIAMDNQEIIDDEETQDEESEVDEAITDEDFFNYVYKEKEININNWIAQKVENTISLTAWAPDGTTIYLEFNKFGDLGKISSYSTVDFDFPDAGNFAYYNSNFFNFELVNIDEDNKKVQVRFSGKLYEDAYDIESDFHEVEGSFIASYVETEPNIAGLGTHALIDGESWYDTSSITSGGFFNGSDISLSQFNDGEFVISITVNHDNTEVGNFNFDTDSSVNFVGFSRYEETTHEFVEYATSGNLIITEKSVGPQLTFLKGKFNLMATDTTNNSTKEVTEGTFYLVYGNY